VWTIPGDPARKDLPPWSIGIAGQAGAWEEQTACFRAGADGTIRDWQPLARAIGPGSRERVLGELCGDGQAVPWASENA
jgi:hypothetical protein